MQSAARLNHTRGVCTAGPSRRCVPAHAMGQIMAGMSIRPPPRARWWKQCTGTAVADQYRFGSRNLRCPRDPCLG